MSALGLQSSICEKSTSFFSGSYLHMALDDDANVVTSRCILSARLGHDRTPIYKLRRMVPSYGSRRYVGSYFCTATHLYLVGTPLASFDIRLSLFSVVSSERQAILRGIVLGVSPRSTILTSRCMLVRVDHIGLDLRRSVFAKPIPKDRLNPELVEVGEYLFGNEKVPYIKESTGE